MLKDNVAVLLNEQINKELFSAYLYLDIANYYTGKGLDGFAHWFKIQAKEEMDHAFKFIGYLQDLNREVSLDGIDKPSIAYKDLRQPLEEALKHEEFISESIDKIFAAAEEAKDYRTQEFLNWFVREQVEEEKNAQDLIVKFDLAGKALMMMDHQLGKR